MDGVNPWLGEALAGIGCRQRRDGRWIFPRTVTERAIRRASRRVDLPGFERDKGLQIGGSRVHIGSGGAAVQTLDANSGIYRDSTLHDLYRMMRVLDQCRHVHYGVRPLVARDMETAFALDINTAYACLAATGKPIGVSFSQSEHLAAACELFDMALGGQGRFQRQPFCMAIIVHVVSPLRYAEDGIEVMRSAIDHGMPVQICTAAQAGATSPASLAGALAQDLAEALAGLVVVDALKPGHPCILALMPFVSDLRTGSMSGGGGETAIASAAAAQLLGHLELPSTVSAGMTDAKLQDAQAGFEKAYSITLAAQAGANMINLSVGMLGSIMVASPEALVIDDEMCGAIMRTVRGIEVTDDALDINAIERAVSGAGHFLGEPETLARMKTEYEYPSLADRRSVAEWLESGGHSIWQRARERVDELLCEPAAHLSISADAKIRAAFDIRLNRETI